MDFYPASASFDTNTEGGGHMADLVRDHVADKLHRSALKAIDMAGHAGEHLSGDFPDHTPCDSKPRLLGVPCPQCGSDFLTPTINGHI